MPMKSVEYFFYFVYGLYQSYFLAFLIRLKFSANLDGKHAKSRRAQIQCGSYGHMWFVILNNPMKNSIQCFQVPASLASPQF